MSAVSYATSYIWTLPSNVTLLNGQGTDSITVTFDAGYVTSVIKVKAVNNCSVSADKSLSVTANPYAVPGTITGNTNACGYINTSDSATYTIRKVAGAPAYIWSVPSGATIASHPGGSGVNDTIIKIVYSGSIVAGTKIQVQTTGCNTSAASSLTLLKAVPAVPSLINGTSSICSLFSSVSASLSSTVRYSINKVSNANTYTWVIPTNVDSIGLITKTDSFIDVQYKSAFLSGSIGVKSENACGASAIKYLAITKSIAATPLAIQKTFTPSIAAITNVAGLTYDTLRIRKVANAISYQWALKIGSNATLTHLSSLENDTAVVVNLSNGFLKDTVSVTTTSYCNTSVAKSIALSALAAPPNVTSISGNLNVCKNNTYTFTVVAPNVTSIQAPVNNYRWVIPATATFDPTYSYSSDSSSVRIILGSSFSGGTISVKAVSAVGVVSASFYTATLKSAVATPTNITSSTGNYFGCVGSSIDYTVVMPTLSSSQQVSSGYRWTIPKNTSITSASVDSNRITLLFNTGYAGGVLSVKAQNTCGIQSLALAKTLSFGSYAKTPIAIISSTNNYAGCIGSTITYKVRDTSNLAGLVYSWTTPSNTSITSMHDSVITLSFASNYTGGNLSVKSTTTCGAVSSSKIVALLAPYVTPTASILSNSGFFGCPGATKVLTAQMPAIIGTQALATSFIWTIPAYTSIINYNTDSSIISLKLNTGYTGGNVTVKGKSACGGLGAIASQSLYKSTGCIVIGGFANSSIRNANTSVEAFETAISPNPSNADFNLSIIGAKDYNSKIEIRIMDMQGRVIKSNLFYSTEESIHFGNDLKSGIYLIQVIQGKNKKTTRVIKY